MYCECLERDGELLISCEWFAGYLYQMHVSSVNHVVYMTDHFSELSTFMADLILDLLTGKAYQDPVDFSCVRNQPEIVKDVRA